MLNYPKTESTFAREVLREINERRLDKRLFPIRITIDVLRRLGMDIGPTFNELRHKTDKAPPNQHGGYSKIPSRYRNREVVSIVRNPYTRFMSRYQYGWWKKYPLISEEKIQRQFPSFPELTIDEFAELDRMKMKHLYDFDDKTHAGPDTVRSIKMFFYKPKNLLYNLTDDIIRSDSIFDEMADVTLLQQESLNRDLTDFLRRHGYTDDELELIHEKGV